MTAYLDTHVLIWLLEGELKHMSAAAFQTLDYATLLVSPMVLLELEYLYEIGRTYFTAKDVHLQMEHDLGIRVCDLPFPRVVEAAFSEKWTRDAFDRLIVGQAKANGYATLVTADVKIREYYPRALW